MPLQYLDLGKATFASKKTSVSVEIKASAALLSETDQHLEVEPSERQGELTIREDVWIRKSHDFRLSFVASTDPNTTNPAAIETKDLDDIESTLKSAQVHFLPDLF